MKYKQALIEIRDSNIKLLHLMTLFLVLVAHADY